MMTCFVWMWVVILGASLLGLLAFLLQPYVLIWIIGILALLGLAARLSQVIDDDILPFHYIAICFIGWAGGFYAFFFKGFMLQNNGVTIAVIIVVPIVLIGILKFLVWAIGGLGEL